MTRPLWVFSCCSGVFSEGGVFTKVVIQLLLCYSNLGVFRPPPALLALRRRISVMWAIPIYGVVLYIYV